MAKKRMAGERLSKENLTPNKPKRTPNHPKKSHVVLAKEGGKEKLIRFGEQGASTAGKPKEGESGEDEEEACFFQPCSSRRTSSKGRCPLLTGLTRSSGNGQRFSLLVWQASPYALCESRTRLCQTS